MENQTVRIVKDKIVANRKILNQICYYVKPLFKSYGEKHDQNILTSTFSILNELPITNEEKRNFLMYILNYDDIENIHKGEMNMLITDIVNQYIYERSDRAKIENILARFEIMIHHCPKNSLNLLIDYIVYILPVIFPIFPYSWQPNVLKLIKYSGRKYYPEDYEELRDYVNSKFEKQKE